MSIINRLINPIDPEKAYQKRDTAALLRILSLQGEKYEQQRAAAAHFLGMLGDQTAFVALQNALTDPSCKVRMDAAEALVTLNPEKAIEPLVSALERNLSTIYRMDPISRHMERQNLVRILALLKSPLSVPVLVKVFGENDMVVRDGLSALLKIQPEGVRALREWLRKTDSPAHRKIFLQKLGEAQQFSLVPVIQEFLSDEDAEVRNAAMVALLNLGNSPAIAFVEAKQLVLTPIIQEFLYDENAEIRKAARLALINLGNPSAISALVQAFNSGSTAEQYDLAWALSKLGWEPADEDLSINSLVYLLQVYADEAMLASIEASLQKFGSEAIVPLTIAAARAQEPYRRETLIRCLAGIKQIDSASPLARFLNDPEESIAQIAWQGIEKFSLDDTFNEVLSAVKSVHLPVRIGAIRKLSGSEKSEAVLALMSTFEHLDPQTRLAGVNALGQITNPLVIPALLRLLDDPYKHTLSNRFMGKPENYQLVSLNEFPVRKAAAAALRRLSSDQAILAKVDKSVFEKRDFQTLFEDLKDTGTQSEESCYCDAH